jgi:D-3-phosphoglycerate dehydrogenase
MTVKVVVTARGFIEVEGPHKELLESQGWEIEYVNVGHPLTPEELAQHLDERVAALILGTDKLDAKVLERAPRLKVISRFGVGLDNLDLDAIKARGVRVTYTPGSNATSVAELAIALILSLARWLPWHALRVQQGNWVRRLGLELQGKVLGLIGLGRIGREVAKRARALGMEVLYHDVRPLASDEEKYLGVQRVSWMELLASSDFLSLHVPLTPETREIIGRDTLARMKRGAFLVNTARGELVDERALYEALVHGHLAGAASDVSSREPRGASPLLQLENFILTPHIGAYTREAVVNTGLMAVENLIAALAGKPAPYGEA